MSGLVTVKDGADVPPKVTAVAPVKLVPVMVTTVPEPPLLGVNEVMVGGGMKVKVPLLVAVPPGVVTVIVPVVPLPTVAVIEVALVTVKEVAAVPPKATAVAPVKLVPVMVTTVPAPPLRRGERGDGRRRDEGEGAAAGRRAAGRGDGDRAGGAAAHRRGDGGRRW